MFNKIKYRTELTLLKIGNFFKTDIKYIAKQGSWMLGGEFINNIIGLVLTISFANLIPVSTYGTYKYILSIYGIFALFGLTGAGSAIIKTVAEGYENVFKPALKTQIKWGMWGSLCLIFVAFYYLFKENSLFGYSFFIAAAALPFFESLNTYLHILAGKKRFDLQTKYYSATRIISSLTLILVLFVSDNVLIILLAYFLPYILSNILFGSFVLKKINLNNKFDPKAITYIKHLSFLNVISFVVISLDGVIIFQLLGPIQLAIYSIASAPSSKLQSLFGIIPELSLPKYTEQPIEEIKKAILPKIFKASIVCATTVIVYVIAVPFLFRWFLPQYMDAIIYAQLLAIPLIWYPLALLSRVLLAKEATKFMFQIGLITSIAQLTIMLLAIYFYGLMGAVVGRIIISIFSYIVIYYYLKRL